MVISSIGPGVIRGAHSTMYLNGSKWQIKKTRRRRSSPWRILLLVALIAGAVYVERVIVPTVPPLFVPTSTPTQNPATIILEAETLSQAGKLSQAEDAYKKAIEIDPENADTYVALARVQVFAGEYEDAETNARNALLVDPNSALANAVLAWSLDFQAAQAASDQDRTAKMLEAESKIDQALKLDPNSALARAYHAEILMDAGDYAGALDEARASLNIDPNTLEGQRAMGYVWERTGNYEQAIEAYQTALRINRNLPLLHISLGDMYLAEGDTDQAVQSYLNAVALSPTSTEPLSRIVLAYARVGDYGIASQYAMNAVDQDPTNPRLRGNLGRMYYKNNEIDKAVEQLGLAIRGGQLEDGSWVQGLQLDPGDSRIVEFYYTYALALAKNDQCADAIPIFEALLRTASGDDIAVANSYEGLVICGAIEPTATPKPETNG
jgi:tetratricopeptide (TPR) repeat protein